MQWSQLKKRAESYLAASLQGRIGYYATQYRHSHDGEGRCWITLDKVQLVDLSTLRAWAEQHRLAARSQGRPADIAWLDHGAIARDSEYWEQWERAEAGRKAAGVFTEWDFRRALEEYISMSVDAALMSPDPLHVALAMVDRRLGQRRFAKLSAVPIAHPIVQILHGVRRRAESWPAAVRAEA